MLPACSGSQVQHACQPAAGVLTARDAGAGLLQALAGGDDRDGGRQHAVAHDHAHAQDDQHADDVLRVLVLHAQAQGAPRLKAAAQLSRAMACTLCTPRAVHRMHVGWACVPCRP